MSTDNHPIQIELLNRLYCLKQQQLLQASQQTDSLLYRVLAAEAQAITEAMKPQS
ncbi:hypothetical protein [Marinobacter caseinilyticus]|uniref:hypothetical protein n=1 Tax=Marinobacter caseinilyticus TaxID=2692195 RepID=UPI0014072CA2|nr:hypothetical protein [Marinobacter caseinilyticus]